MIQQALAQVLTPLFESGFSRFSYSFREGRNAHQAVRHVEACWTEGRSVVTSQYVRTGFGREEVAGIRRRAIGIKCDVTPY